MDKAEVIIGDTPDSDGSSIPTEQSTVSSSSGLVSSESLRLKLASVPEESRIAPKGDVLLQFSSDANGHFTKCLLVSSVHLCLKSRVFKAMLAGQGFMEVQALRDQGCIQLELPEDDYDAFALLMNVVHGHSFRVPKSLNLTELVKVTTLVDKYEWHEVIGFYADRWIGALRPYMPTNKMRKELIPWLWISWVFKLEDEFQRLTRIATRESRQSDFSGTLKYRGWGFPNEVRQGPADCPVPSSVIDAIERERQSALSALKKRFDDQCSDFWRSATSGDSLLGNALAYGVCQRQGSAIGLADQSSLFDHSFLEILHDLRAMEDTEGVQVV